MRFLWMSNSPWSPTGYGAQTKHMLPLLRDQGHDVACFAYWGLEGSPIHWEGFKVYPPIFDKYGNDAVREHMRDWQAEALFTLFDPFVIYEEYIQPVGWRWFPWVPIDSDGLPHGFDVLKQARLVIAMSEHGRRQLLEAGYDDNRVFMIPHGVDCRVHRNRTEEQRRAVRETLGLDPEAFIVGMVQANKGDRKAIDVQIKAFAEFRRQYKADDAHLYLHIEPTSAMGGIDIEDELMRLGLKDQNIVHRTGLYPLRVGVEESTMSTLYGCFDVLLQVTSGEGFGIPIIEAQANGVPVIVNDCTSMPELVANGGWVAGDPSPMRARHGGTHYLPRMQSIVDCLGDLYKLSWEQVQQRRDDARLFAEQFDWPNLAEKCWRPLLSVIEDAVAPRVWSSLGEFNGKEREYLPGQAKRVGFLWGPDVESGELDEWVLAMESPVLELVICPPDQIAWGLDAYMIVDELNYADEDLDRIIASDAKVWGLLLGDAFGSRKEIHDRMEEMFTVDAKWILAAEIHGMSDDNRWKITTVSNPYDMWERVAKCLI